MGMKSLKPCKHPACSQLTHNSYCESHAIQHLKFQKEKIKQYDKNRPEYQNWYNIARWRKERLIFLSANPLCVECFKNDILKSANVVDHIKPHLGNYALFWDVSNWQSLCEICHSRLTAIFDGGFGNRSRL